MSRWPNILAALTLTTASTLAGASSMTDTTLNFRVLLDGDPIGQHRFELRGSGDSREVVSQADFKVRFLFVDVYRYQHKATERWRGDCLVSMDARTDDNGDIEIVDASRRGGGLAVTANNRQEFYEGCVRSFAYWNPTILDGGRLLNAQTGQYMPIRVQPLGEENIPVMGRTIPTERYRLTGQGVQIDLWYTRDQQWVALESSTGDGRRLRYERN